MKPTIALALMMAAAMFVASAADRTKGITIDGRLNCPYISFNGGKVYLQVAVTAPGVESPRRQPLNLSVVLDRSGSMADEAKINYAKRALYALIDQLRDDDILSIVIYDDVIEVLRPAQRVRDKGELKRLVERVEPRGSTNLGGGMLAGLRQVECNLDREYVNRVILLSDGLANQGITDPSELRRIARRYRARSISLTTMGVGLDFNENLMVGLAESGGGNYYFIESPHSLASIFRKEFNLLSCMAAQNASIELTPGAGVRLLDVIGYEYRKEGERYVVPLGDLYSDDRRELTVELEVPEGTGTLTVARGVLHYDARLGWFQRWPSFTARAQYTNDMVVIEKNRDLETQAKADVAVSTRGVERAMKALDEGRYEEAAERMKGAEMFISASPAAASIGGAGAAVREQKLKLQSYESILRDSSDTRKAKKSIQYDNYRTQKQRR
jgi:Ca-activated chloride channel family protein